MTAIGSLRVELELADGSFTTRVIRAGTTLQQLERQVRQTVVAVRRMDSTIGNFGSSMRDMVVTLGLARAAVENLYSVFGSWATAIVKANAEVEKSVSLLKSMSDASTDVERTKQAREEFQQLLALSGQSPFQLQSLTSAFVKMKAAGIEPAARQLQGLVDAVAAMGGTDDQFNRAATAIQQMAGKGVISMEELRQQLGEAVPRAIELMARSMNMTVAQFTRKVSQGSIESKAALASLAAEFDRTFGGAAAAQMDTFNGKLAQLRTAWVNFALVVGGDPGSGGFFDKVKDFVQTITDVLKSEDARDFGVRLNRGLASFTETLTNGVKLLVDWSSAIEQVARSLLIFYAAVKAVAIVEGLAAGFAAFRASLMAVPAVAQTATAAVTGFRNAYAGLTMMAAVSPFAGMAASVQTFAAQVGTAVSRMTAFSRVLVSIAGTGFVVGALAIIADALLSLRGRAAEAAEAMERFKEGATDKQTLDSVRVGIAALDKQIAEREKQVENIRRARAALDSQPNSEVNILRRRVEANEPNARENLDDFLAAREAAERQITDQIVALRNERSLRLTRLEGAERQRAERAAQIAADRELAALNKALSEVSRVYDEEQKKLAKKREELVAASVPEKDQQFIDLNAQELASRKASYDARLHALNEFVVALEKRLETASQIEQEYVRKAIEDARKSLEARRAAGNLDGSFVEISANAENSLKVANAEIARMKARIAELNGEMQGTNPALTKMEELLKSLSRMEILPADTKEKLRDAARELGETRKEYELFKKAVTAQRQLDSFAEKAKADIAAFREQLDDLSVSDNERQFKQFERVVMAAFQNAVLGAGDAVEAVDELYRKMQDILQLGRQATGLRTLTDFLQEGEKRVIRQLPKTDKERLKLETERLERQRSYMLGLAKLSQNPDRETAEVNRIIDADIAAAQRAFDTATANAGRKTTNMLDALKGRVAELTDELSNGGGEWAKYAAKLGEAGSKTSAGSKILEYAKEVDELTKKVEIAKNAWSTLENLVRRGDEGRRELDITLDMLRGGFEPTGMEAGYIREAAKAQRALDDLTKQGIAAGAEFQAAQMRLQGLPGFAQGEVDKQIISWRQAQRQFRESSADSLADRRRIAEENVRIEEESIRRLIAATDAKGEKLKAMEDELQAYLKMRREQVARDTEGPIRKMLRDWGNLSDNIESSFARAFDGMADALTEFVMTGKLSFTSLANSLIRDLTRIAMKAAASGLFDLMKPAGGGMDFLKSIGGFIGGLFGGGSPMAGVDANYAAYNHAGGIVGGNNPMMQVNPAWFAGANRYHSGSLRPDEVPTILQKGEAVFTSAQLAELGRLNRSYEFVERSLGAINSALTAPVSAMPAMPAAPMGGAGGMAPPVTVNIINQSGQQLEATAGAPRMDIEGMIIDVVVSNIQRPGRMRDAVKGVV